MTKEIKITKDKILKAAFDIVRNNGIEEVSNRAIAKKLECSIRPIYYQFNNSEELKKELYSMIEEYLYLKFYSLLYLKLILWIWF